MDNVRQEQHALESETSEIIGAKRLLRHKATTFGSHPALMTRAYVKFVPDLLDIWNHERAY